MGASRRRRRPSVEQTCEAKLPAFGHGEQEQCQRSQDTCYLCMDRAADAVLVECGHGGLCVKCADTLWRQGEDGRCCPLCRHRFIGVMRIVSETEAAVRVEPTHYPGMPESPRAALSAWGEAVPDSGAAVRTVRAGLW